MLPPWLQPIVATLPLWIQWLIPMALNVLVQYVLPALEKALPQEAQLIQDLAQWLLGKPVSAPLVAAYKHYHEKVAELKGVVS